MQPVDVNGLAGSLNEEVVDAIAQLRREWEAGAVCVLSWRRW